MIYLSIFVGVLAGASGYVGTLHWKGDYIQISPACSLLLLFWCAVGGAIGGGSWWLLAITLSK